MHCSLSWDGIEEKGSDIPGEWRGALNALSGARQAYEVNTDDGYHAFAFAGNDSEQWAVMLLWREGDKKHPHVLWVYEGRKPGFDAELLRVGM